MYTVDNRSTSLADYTPFSILAPVDSRLPNGGGYTVDGLYNLVNAKIGQVDELAQASSNFAEQKENWQGVDLSVMARLRQGLTIQGGTSTGRRLSDACALRTAVPEQGAGPSGAANTSIAGGSVTNPYCRVVEPYVTEFKGLASYTIPKADVQVSGTWSSTPGSTLAANYTVTSAIAQPSLGRPLSQGNVTVNLIAPNTIFADRRNNIDLRIAKIFRYNRTRTQVGFDIYNLTNRTWSRATTKRSSPTAPGCVPPRFSRPATPGSARSSTSKRAQDSRLKAPGMASAIARGSLLNLEVRTEK